MGKLSRPVNYGPIGHIGTSQLWVVKGYVS